MLENLSLPNDENENFTVVKNCVEKCFASRGKNATKLIEETWITEILNGNFSVEAIKKATSEFCRSEEYALLLPTFLTLISKCSIKKYEVKKDCEWCHGRGYVYNTIFFANNGEYENQNYALKCYHNENSVDCLTFDPKKETQVSVDGYFRVFKTYEEREEYLEKVRKNNWFDVGVVLKEETEEDEEEFMEYF